MTGAPVVKIWRGESKLWYWHRISGGRIVADGSQGYWTRWGCKRAARRANPTTPIRYVP